MTLKTSKTRMGVLSAALLAATALTAPQAAVAGDDFAEALKGGKLILDLRLRQESVSQDGFSDDASGLTLRTRMGYETADYRGMKFLVEFENVTNVDDEDYDNTVNGNTQYPKIVDPDTTELNRAQVTFTGVDGFKVVAGRQRINLGNQRFVGAVGWRQNEQTFDSILVQNTMIENTTLTYAFVDRVQRIVGDDNPGGSPKMAGHLINADYKIDKVGTVSAYGYLLDYDDSPSASTQTYGVRFHGKSKQGDVTVLYDAEYAQQSDYADNTNDVDVDFYSVNAGIASQGFVAKVGYDVLGGDDGFGFQTPLATGHKWQGFADMFLTTPDEGVKDLHATVSYTTKEVPVVEKVKVQVWYHDFEGDDGGMDMGSEWDALIAVGIGKGLSASIKYADYDGDDFKPDTQKLWVSLGYKF